MNWQTTWADIQQILKSEAAVIPVKNGVTSIFSL